MATTEMVPGSDPACMVTISSEDAGEELDVHALELAHYSLLLRVRCQHAARHKRLPRQEWAADTSHRVGHAVAEN